jgi:HK97 family phage prohead protease
MDKNKKKQFMLFTPETMHVREHVREDGTKESSRTIYGRAIVFNKVFEYEDYWGDKYRETIKPSACTKEFLESQDIKLNLLHKREMSIARSNCGEGNLRYSVSDEGVDFEFEAPNCDLGDRALEMVRSGVYTGCSFEFYPKDYECNKFTAEGKTVYEINHTAFEKVSALTIAMDPAYKETTVDCRERYEVSAPAATVLGSSASEPNTTAAPADTTDQTARESARISQSREIAALQREILYEDEYNSSIY